MTFKISSRVIVSHFLRCIRIISDLFMNIIGIIYPSKRHYLPPITNEILLQPAIVITEKIRTGKLKCEDVVTAYIDRIRLVNPHVNALVQDRFVLALEEAKQIDRRVHHELIGNMPIDGVSISSLPLLGIPFTTKDCISVKDMHLTGGLYARKDFVSDRDANIVTNLRNAGAIPIGVTNVPEFLLWWDSSNNIYGTTNNPYDKSRIAGGSSGGEAALLSAGGSIVGIGTDIGGSIRIPAFCCGVFGHKSTPGIVPIDGLFPPMDQPNRLRMLSFGPLCRYACDIRPMLKATAGDKSHQFNLDQKTDITKLKIYYMEGDSDPFKTPVHSDIKETMDKVISFLNTKTTVSSKRVQIKKMKYSFFIWLCTIANVDTPRLADELTLRKGRVNGWTEIIKWFIGMSNFRLVTILNVILESIANPEANRENEMFKKLVKYGENMKKELSQLLGDDGVFIYPTQPETAPKHNGTFLKMVNCAYTAIFNVLEVPVTQVPLGLSKGGLPVGLQIVASPFNDHLTITIAEELEKEFGGWRPPCDIKC